MTSEQNTNPEDEAPKKRWRNRRAAKDALEAPTLGYIPATPTTPAPVLADPVGDAANAYRQTIDRIQAATKAHVLLVAGSGHGLGASFTSLNLGMAAVRVGLRAVVIDGDITGGGPSRFLRTGAAPGLSDIADGTADLREASRLLEMDAGHRLSMIPAGAAKPGGDFAAADIADAVDLISEHADLVFVYLPADATDERAAALGAHADGSVLIVDEGDPPAEASAAAERLEQIGAPVAGVVERAVPKGNKRRRHRS